MYFWFNFLIWIVGTFWFGLFFALALEPRWKQIPRWAMAFGFAVIVIPITYLKILNPLSQVFYWAAFIAMLLYVFTAFREKLWKKILLIFLFFACTEISNFPMTCILDSMHLTFDDSFDSLQMMMLVSANTLIVFTLTAFLLVIWNRLIMRKTVSRTVFVFFTFPISQFALLIAFDGYYRQTSTFNHILASIGAFLGFISDFAMLYILLGQSEKEALSRRVNELETIRRLQEIHYQSIEARREEMAKLRHDFNNQLTTAYNLTKNGEKKEAEKLLDELKISVERNREYVYCGNPIVNAVLTEKASECEKYNISIKSEMELFEEPQIQSVLLCSIFSNLLDNAIHAAKECPDGQRFITVRAAHQGNYLHVKIENSALDPKMKKKGERKGYGQEILADIAAQYDGELICGWENGVYSAMVSLTVKDNDYIAQ